MHKKTHHIKGDPQVGVRKANPSDAAGIASIYPAFLSSYGHLSDAEAAKPFISNLLNEPWVLFFVATEGPNKVVGFLGGTLTYSAVSHRKAFTINDLFVTPSARRRGIAKALLSELEVFAQGNGLVKLFVDVAEEAKTVIGIFRNTGYVVRPHLTLIKEL